MVRIEEIIYVLQELARLVIHPDTASALPLPSFLKEGLARNEKCNGRAHLICLFPSFCELVVSRSVPRNILWILLFFLNFMENFVLQFTKCFVSKRQKTKKIVQLYHQSDDFYPLWGHFSHCLIIVLHFYQMIHWAMPSLLHSSPPKTTLKDH